MKNTDCMSPAPISIELDGKTYNGHFTTRSGVVTVVTNLGRRSTHLGGQVAENLAKSVLHELVRDGKAQALLAS